MTLALKNRDERSIFLIAGIVMLGMVRPSLQIQRPGLVTR